MPSDEERFAAGLSVMREMFGARADQMVESGTDFTRPLDDMVMRYCFGDLWQRPQLSRKLRSMLTLAILATLNRPNEFKGHVAGAIKNGVSKEEIREVLLHTMVYAGVPVGVSSLRAAVEVLKELGLE